MHSPKSILLQISRCDDSHNKIKNPVTLPDTIQEPLSESEVYNLVSVIHHHGESLDNGHYTAHTQRGGHDEDWNEWDDARYRPIEDTRRVTKPAENATSCYIAGYTSQIPDLPLGEIPFCAPSIIGLSLEDIEAVIKNKKHWYDYEIDHFVRHANSANQCAADLYRQQFNLGDEDDSSLYDPDVEARLCDGDWRVDRAPGWIVEDPSPITIKHHLAEIVSLALDEDLFPIKKGVPGDMYDPFLQKLIKYKYGLRVRGSFFLSLSEHLGLMGHDISDASLRQNFLAWVNEEYEKGDDSEYSDSLHYLVDGVDVGVYLSEERILSFAEYLQLIEKNEHFSELELRIVVQRLPELIDGRGVSFCILENIANEEHFSERWFHPKQEGEDDPQNAHLYFSHHTESSEYDCQCYNAVTRLPTPSESLIPYTVEVNEAILPWEDPLDDMITKVKKDQHWDDDFVHRLVRVANSMDLSAAEEYRNSFAEDDEHLFDPDLESRLHAFDWNERVKDCFVQYEEEDFQQLPSNPPTTPEFGPHLLTQTLGTSCEPICEKSARIIQGFLDFISSCREKGVPVNDIKWFDPVVPKLCEATRRYIMKILHYCPDKVGNMCAGTSPCTKVNPNGVFVSEVWGVVCDGAGAEVYWNTACINIFPFQFKYGTEPADAVGEEYFDIIMDEYTEFLKLVLKECDNVALLSKCVKAELIKYLGEDVVNGYFRDGTLISSSGEKLEVPSHPELWTNTKYQNEHLGEHSRVSDNFYSVLRQTYGAANENCSVFTDRFNNVASSPIYQNYIAGRARMELDWEHWRKGNFDKISDEGWVEIFNSWKGYILGIGDPSKVPVGYSSWGEWVRDTKKGIFDPSKVPAGYRNWGEWMYDMKKGIFDPSKVPAGYSSWGEWMYDMKIGFFDPKYADKLSDWRSKGGESTRDNKKGWFDSKYDDKRSDWRKKSGEVKRKKKLAEAGREADSSWKCMRCSARGERDPTVIQSSQNGHHSHFHKVKEHMRGKPKMGTVQGQARCPKCAKQHNEWEML